MIALSSCLVLIVLRFVGDIKGLFILPDLKDIVLNNKVAKYQSGISMEIYLCHMMFFRVASMLYVATCIATLIGAICFSHVIKYYVFKRIENKRR